MPTDERPLDEIDQLMDEIVAAAQDRPHEFRPWVGAGCELCGRRANAPVHEGGAR